MQQTGQTSPSPPNKELKLRLILIGVLVLFVSAVFAPLYLSEFVYDDLDYVVNNAHVNTGISFENIRWAFFSFHSANWHPLTWISHAIDCSLFGLNPGGHHLVNVAFHLANCILLFILLRMLTKTLWPSWLVSMLFAVHPMHVESVAWIADRKDLLCTMFWFLALISYVQHLKNRSQKRYLLSLLFFICGILSKPIIVTLPLTLLILDWWPLRRSDRSIRSLVIEKLPFFALSVFSSLMTISAQSQFGAIVPLDYNPWGIRVSNIINGYGMYLLKLFWPTNLAVYYPLDTSVPLVQTVSVFLALLLFSLFIFIFRTRRYLTSGWAWFLLTLVPMIGFVQVGGASMADRYSYVSYIGLFLIVIYGGNELAKKSRQRERLLFAAACTVITTFSYLSWKQTSYWKDGFVLWHHAAEVTKDNDRAYHSLGVLYDHVGDLQSSLENYQTAVVIDPTNAEVQNNLGSVLFRLEKYDEAEKRFVQAVTLDEDNADAHNNLGTALAHRGDFSNARTEFQLALKLNATHPLAKRNLDLALEILSKNPPPKNPKNPQ